MDLLKEDLRLRLHQHLNQTLSRELKMILTTQQVEEILNAVVDWVYKKPSNVISFPNLMDDIKKL